MSDVFKNAFDAQSDPERHGMWEMLHARDSEAFVSGDWGMVDGDFDHDHFEGIVCEGVFEPDRWRVTYPTVASYRDAWKVMSREFLAMRLPAGVSHRELIYRVTRLDVIEITGDRALAHKKFLGEQVLAGGGVYRVQAQTLYRLHRRGSGWKIVGFIGYLPLAGDGQRK
jgi:hypothetical protein